MYIFQRNSELFHCVKLSEGDCLLVEGLEVDGDAEGDTDLICPGVSFADGVAGVVYFAGNQMSFEPRSFV